MQNKKKMGRDQGTRSVGRGQTNNFFFCWPYAGKSETFKS